MERRRQTFEEIISSLSRIESEWKDAHAKSVMDLLDGIEEINRGARTKYKVSVGVLNAAQFGVPQIRERVFLVG